MSLRGQWIFDDRGNFVAVDSYALRSMLPSLQYNGDLARDLARNLGFIAISPRGAWTQIRLRPQVVSDVAFANLMYWLADNQPSHIVIDAMDGSTVAPIFSETKGALAHLIEQMGRLAVFPPNALLALDSPHVGNHFRHRGGVPGLHVQIE